LYEHPARKRSGSILTTPEPTRGAVTAELVVLEVGLKDCSCVKTGKGVSMSSVPVAVEGVSDLPFQGPACSKRRWPVTPSPPYLRPRPGLLITAEWAGRALGTELSA